VRTSVGVVEWSSSHSDSEDKTRPIIRAHNLTNDLLFTFTFEVNYTFNFNNTWDDINIAMCTKFWGINLRLHN